MRYLPMKGTIQDIDLSILTDDAKKELIDFYQFLRERYENNINIKVEGLTLFSLPIPSFALNILLHNVYVFKQDITPCRVVLNDITIENEYLRIN
jgi:hypothetical protein